MGQSSSVVSVLRRGRSKAPSTSSAVILQAIASEGGGRGEEDTSTATVSGDTYDYTSNLPDDCLACIFQSLSSGDRKQCSLVCHRWLRIEGQSRRRLSLKAQPDLLLMIPSLFSRFDAVIKLALKCDRRSPSIDDEALVKISERCQNLTRLKLRACRDVSDVGMAAFSENCKGLKKLSCGSCAFRAKGMNAVLDNCSSLEELTVKRLRGIADGAAAEAIGPGAAAASLKTICLKELYNGQCFAPLLIAAKNLRSLKIFRCSGDWDRVLEDVADHVNGIVEIHLERIQVSDLGLAAISNCSNIEILHLVKTPDCTNTGLITLAKHCKLLRRLHIDGWKANRISDEGLIAVAKSSWNLQELVLIGVNPTKLSIEAFASNCQNLERLALCGSETVGNPELCCIAEKCVALRKLCIKNCPITDEGMEALAVGCPNLVKVKVKKCRGVTLEGVDWLRTKRTSLAVNLDTPEQENQERSASETGARESGMEFPALPRGQVPALGLSNGISSSGTSRTAAFRSRLGSLTRRNLVAYTLRRWGSPNIDSLND
ncbi:PREDICTED: putative F-box/LRR-repeat protein 8 [Tarenaya hassleriana]|uniref:putative F-box/LRR-repeat protein 8 n=1 Tax=Tarenaya hassleriana TaxID=28532 RepID=UPI00053C1B9D|nr:PREDICTED: putative F-box/LRR-repeat protein 8 [Tarenaya hassleriana]